MEIIDYSQIKSRLEKTSENLERNNIQSFIVDSADDVAPLIKSLICEGETVANGGSVTLAECGIIDLLKSGRYIYIDRNSHLLSPEQKRENEIRTFGADTYFCSSNAVTENGELYNVDGNSNRVAAICYGPKSVIMVVGYNKIVKNIDEAIQRVKTTAAPKNCKRLSCKTFCNETGKCVSLNNENSKIADGCSSNARICCNYLISAYQRHIHRIKVILVCEELGY
ncbi:MAG: lactate utilization protein [Oscillospiraceae bacterium]|jgi:hypothetical protein